MSPLTYGLLSDSLRLASPLGGDQPGQSHATAWFAEIYWWTYLAIPPDHSSWISPMILSKFRLVTSPASPVGFSSQNFSWNTSRYSTQDSSWNPFMYPSKISPTDSVVPPETTLLLFRNPSWFLITDSFNCHGIPLGSSVRICLHLPSGLFSGFLTVFSRNSFREFWCFVFPSMISLRIPFGILSRITPLVLTGFPLGIILGISSGISPGIFCSGIPLRILPGIPCRFMQKYLPAFYHELLHWSLPGFLKRLVLDFLRGSFTGYFRNFIGSSIWISGNSSGIPSGVASGVSWGFLLFFFSRIIFQGFVTWNLRNSSWDSYPFMHSLRYSTEYELKNSYGDFSWK